MKIGLILDSASRDRILGNDLVRQLNQQFDELVLEYVTVYMGPRDRTLIAGCIGELAKTETNQVGTHADKMVYGFRVKDIIVNSTLRIEPTKAVLPVAVNRKLGGKIQHAISITQWHFIPTIELTGRLTKIG